MTLLQHLLRSTISGYRKVVSPLLPASCRFYPTCSSYAAEAVQRHGAARGSLLALRRLLRCHPWHPGGFDPVPRAGRGAGSRSGGTVDIGAGRAPTK